MACRPTRLIAGVALLVSMGLTSGAFAEPSPLDLPPCPSDLMPTLSIQSVIIPAAGEQRQTDVGGLLFVSDQVAIAEAGLILERGATVSGKYAGGEYVIGVPPDTYTLVDVAHLTYLVPNATFRYLREKNERHGSSKPDIGISANSDGTSLQARVSFGLISRTVPIQDATFHRQLCRRPSNRGFRTEIRYGGTAKGIMTLQYREFSGGVARPAFSQDATFDLAEGKDISFRGVHLKVLTTSNAGIRYVVTMASPPAAAS